MLACAVLGASAYPVYYKEQFYRLYHLHYIEYPDDAIENIYWLERAKRADFCNPLYALAKIEDQRHWERYRYLLDMHLDLKLIEQHLALGSKFDKRVAYFFNAPWKKQTWTASRPPRPPTRRPWATGPRRRNSRRRPWRCPGSSSTTRRNGRTKPIG